MQSQANMALLFLAGLLLTVIYFYLKYTVYNVWKRAGLPHDTPSIPLGNLPLDYIRRKVTIESIMTNNYKKYKKFPLHGTYIGYIPVLVICDPKIIRLVLEKNSNIFLDRGFYSDVKNDLISSSLARANGDRWGALRRSFSSSFTPKKVKFMFTSATVFCNQLIELYDESLQKSDIVRIDELTTRFTIDCAFTMLFGFNCNILKNTDNEFYKYGKQSNQQGAIYSILNFYIPELAALCLLPKIRKDNNSFFERFFQNVVACQKENNTATKNLLGTIMQLMDNRSDSKDDKAARLTEREAAAQFVTFFSAAQGMPAFAITHCLYELAFYPEIQETLYDEIYQTACKSEELTYQTLSELPYLNLVFKETLRKHSPIPVLNRIASEDFPIPEMDLVITKNMRVAIPLQAIHLDPDIYPDPEKFDPTRFTPENKAKRHACTYMPFGAGPRFCVGKLQGILVPKVALFHLILNYKFSVCDKTPKTLEYSPEHLIQMLKNEIHLKIERRTAPPAPA